ncbi:MAG: phosphoribosylanthranilate isomerase [Planctomycetota bacterium]
MSEPRNVEKLIETSTRRDVETPGRTRIKVCGVRDVSTARAAVVAGADLIGLVFVEKSPRFVTVEQAKTITEALPPGVEAVGLFCDHSAKDVQKKSESAGLQAVQLHGHEQPNFTEQLTGLRVIKAVGFDAGSLAQSLSPWRGCSASLSAVLIDTPPEPDAAITGGSGESFDWETLARLDTEGMLRDLPPMILAGGLTAQNVGLAIRTVRPYAVDVSSGVESSRGTKDAGMISDFCAAVRAADADVDPG